MTTKERIIYRAHMSKGFKDRDYIVSAEEKGREEGMAKGIEEGEVTKSIKIAKKMLMKKTR
ncbi:MAG: hypothetical protein LN546_07055 [Rickettsia endosymbiont of Ecitomorpha arachnoides]|nr:hypothetical protein [Rickettsia endosymbiont of Ecitomorpha arachnoides]